MGTEKTSILSIGKQTFPFFPLSVITAIICYTWCILPTQVDNIIWLSVTASVILILFIYIVSFLFVRDMITNRSQYKGLGMVYGVIDMTFSLIHALSLIMYSIVISRGIAADFSEITIHDKGYALFWIHCLPNTLGFFFSAGKVNSNGISAWGVLHNDLAIVTGAFVTLLAMAFAVSKLVSRSSEKEGIEGKIRIRNKRSNV